MKRDLDHDAVLRLIRLVADRLEGFLDGDETAFETLGESIEQDDFTAEAIQSAVLVLRSLGPRGSGAEPLAVERAPAKDAQRVLSAEERESVSPEAWGYLLDLKRRGSLNHEQLERVLDFLTGCGVRPVGVDLVREIATRVALEFEPEGGGAESPHGNLDLVQ